jgi:hypothetical protein
VLKHSAGRVCLGVDRYSPEKIRSSFKSTLTSKKHIFLDVIFLLKNFEVLNFIQILPIEI